MTLRWNFVLGSTITNVPCCEVSRTGQPGVQCIANGETCANRTQYAYWDGVHPTEVSYEFLAERAYNAQSPTYASPYDIKHLAQLQWTQDDMGREVSNESLGSIIMGLPFPLWFPQAWCS